MADDHRWTHPHLLALEGLPADDLRFLLRTALGFEGVSTRSVKKVPALRGRVVVNLFFEDSTRTRNSFTLAAQRLSADVIEFAGKGSSVSKGETLADTARTIEAMGVDVMVIRHGLSGAAVKLAQSVSCSVINAGDGQHEHPTQGLLDAFTIAKRFGRTDDFDLSGLTVGIVGDIAHSRVARSNIWGLTKLGAKVVLVGPPTLLPGAFRELGAEVDARFGCGVARAGCGEYVAGAARADRTGEGGAFPSVREYAAMYGLTAARLKRAKPGAVVMHPGPMNRGVEIEGYGGGRATVCDPGAGATRAGGADGVPVSGDAGNASG